MIDIYVPNTYSVNCFYPLADQRSNLPNPSFSRVVAMPGRRWTDTPRFEFLTECIPGYEAAQETNTSRSYLADLHERYFNKFPQADEERMAAERKVRELRYVWNDHLLTLRTASQRMVKQP